MLFGSIWTTGALLVAGWAADVVEVVVVVVGWLLGVCGVPVEVCDEVGVPLPELLEVVVAGFDAAEFPGPLVEVSVEPPLPPPDGAAGPEGLLEYVGPEFVGAFDDVLGSLFVSPPWSDPVTGFPVTVNGGSSTIGMFG